MKKWIWITIAVVVFYAIGQTDSAQPESNARQPSTSTSPQQSITRGNDAEYLYVTGNRVNQRNGPGTANRVMGQLNKAARVRFVAESDGWTQVVSSLGNGWMSSSYLSSVRPTVTGPDPRTPTRSVAVPSSREIQAARREIIRQSIASYSGSCPCPYNVDRGGRRCGARSAWSRPGGYSPICYNSDVSNARLESYFARRR